MARWQGGRGRGGGRGGRGSNKSSQKQRRQSVTWADQYQQPAYPPAKGIFGQKQGSPENGSFGPKQGYKNHRPGNIKTNSKSGSSKWWEHDYDNSTSFSFSKRNGSSDDDGDLPMETPAGAVTPALRRYALRSQKEYGSSTAWRKMLGPLTAKDPLPYEYERLLDVHFNTPYELRPAALRFGALEISDYARYRDETNCFVCAALCEKILKKRAEYATLTSKTPSPRYIAISPNMSEFLHNCPSLAKLIGEINVACYNKDASHLRRSLLRPDEAEGDHAEFLASLQEELRRTCPAEDEALLLQSLDTLTLAGWLSAKPVVLQYLRLIRSWTQPTSQEQLAGLKKMIEDVSQDLERFYSAMSILQQ